MDHFPGKIFDKLDPKITPLVIGEYENCKFNNCDLSNANFSEFKLVNCEFNSCNLSLVRLNKTVLQNVKFKDCKLLGLLFEKCNPFGLELGLDSCNLNHSSFYKLKLKKIIFRNCQLQEADFSECDLSNSVFNNCDLSNTKFENTVLEKADLRGSVNFSIDPELNKIKKAKFSLTEIRGLLDKYDIEIEG
jgi:fluoroquinolone resistance protein